MTPFVSPNADDFARIEAAFGGALALDPEGRAGFLATAFTDRPDLRGEVEALLSAHDRMAPVSDDVTRTTLDVGSRVGPFVLVEKVGEGGMGEVYRAERADGAFDQRVAVKITRAAINRDDIRRRFRIERQILASLNHPNIVTLLDGGATDEGHAYFVMEHVDGVPLTLYCRQRELGLEERLRLFRTVCGAVQYAHQHGIVHRDLKPANILVQPDGVPKVLDFGLAKLLHEPTVADSTTTLLPGPLTPNYASPEQLRGLPVTTAGDVYALGVLLYELVTGARPYETQGQPLDRVVEIVVRETPPLPSAVASKTAYPASRLRGDIDAIVSKAMSKEPAERYDSAGELSSDVARVLRREPVLARPQSTMYVLRRLAARHRARVSIVALALLAVLGASGVAWWQRQIARREQARAELLFRDVRQLANSLIFKVHDAVVPLPGSTEVRRTIVNDAVAYLERLEAQSGGDAALRLELAGAYRQIAGILGDPQKPNLGDRDGAVRQYERSRAVAATLLTPNAPFEAVDAFARASQLLSTLYALKGDRATAVTTAQDAVDRVMDYARGHPDDPRGTKLAAVSDFYLAWALPPKESIPVWERALAYYENELTRSPDSTELRRNAALMSKYLAPALKNTGQLDASEQHYRRALALDEARLRAAPGDRQTRLDAAISYGSMGEFLQQRGNLTEAATLFARSVELRRQVATVDPKDVQAQERLAFGLTMAGQVRGLLGEAAEARTLLREAIQVQDKVLALTGDTSGRRQLANAWFELGVIEEGARNVPAACAAFDRARQSYAAVPSALLDAEKERLAVADAKSVACR